LSIAPSITPGARQDLEERYRQASELWPKDRIEIISNRLVLSPSPTRAHELVIFQLSRLLMPTMEEHDWILSFNISLFLGGERDRYKPDLTVAPANPPLWGDDHIHGGATILVAEVVSEITADCDHNVKPRTYAAADVPLCLIIDCFEDTVQLLSRTDPDAGRYEMCHEVSIGAEIELPAPWDLTLDTGKLTD
jgi:hypothetical protein